MIPVHIRNLGKDEVFIFLLWFGENIGGRGIEWDWDMANSIKVKGEDKATLVALRWG
jgi:hypothetical protein